MGDGQNVQDMTHAAFVVYLKNEVQRYGSQRAAAHAWGISQQYLCDVLRARRLPGPAILRAVGYELRQRYAPSGEGEKDGDAGG